MSNPHRNSFRAQLRLRGENVVYLTADGVRLPMRAVRGQTPFRLESRDSKGATIERSVDWLVDLWQFRQAVGRWPIAGDRVECSVDLGTVRLSTVFRVKPFNSEPCYRTDPALSHVRIHTEEWQT